MEVGVSGAMEGSFKQAFSYIKADSKWCLVTGSRSRWDGLARCRLRQGLKHNPDYPPPL
ncbi:hypothetical protein LY78DRAFT_662231 [Colletotrichum sublineola]|nr:hypothetical protein LY78DRAFT_662231 [Colletotrichum sublineola]